MPPHQPAADERRGDQMDFREQAGVVAWRHVAIRGKSPQLAQRAYSAVPAVHGMDDGLSGRGAARPLNRSPRTKEESADNCAVPTNNRSLVWMEAQLGVSNAPAIIAVGYEFTPTSIAALHTPTEGPWTGWQSCLSEFIASHA